MSEGYALLLLALFWVVLVLGLVSAVVWLGKWADKKQNRRNR